MPVTLFVCNLPLDIQEKYLQGLFSRYGEVFSVKIIRDRLTQQSKGFGFIRMSERDCENALQHLNGFNIKDRKLIVKYDNKNFN